MNQVHLISNHSCGITSGGLRHLTKPSLITVHPDPDPLFTGAQHPTQRARERERASAYVASPPGLVNPRLLAGRTGSPAAAGRRPVHPQPPSTCYPSTELQTLARRSPHTAPSSSAPFTRTQQSADPEISRTARTRRAHLAPRSGASGAHGRR